MDSLHSEKNPYIKATASHTLLSCANQLAQTLCALRTTLDTEFLDDRAAIQSLPSRLLGLPPSPSRLQCEHIEQPLRQLHTLQYTLSQRANTQSTALHVDILSKVIQAVRYELGKC